jgi:hypothetical protein
MKARENKVIFTSLPPVMVRRCARELLHGPFLGFLEIFLEGVAPTKLPANGTKDRGCRKTWPPKATFSIKNRFRIFN